MTDSLNLPSNPSLSIGANYGGSDSTTADLAEIIIYDRKLSDQERQAVEAYLAQKWLDEPYAKNCQELYKEGQTTDGTYTIDPDGYNGPMPAMTAQCDFETSGPLTGGWTLILNYLHQGGTSPSLKYFRHNLPQLGSDTLGTDESGSATTWGHTPPSMLGRMEFDEMRFFCKTSGHDRVWHFKTSDTTCQSYMRTGENGTNPCSGVEASATLLEDNSAIWGDSSWYENSGDNALTEYVFYHPGYRHWSIGTASNRWECDDYPNNNSRNTLHRVWVK